MGWKLHRLRKKELCHSNETRHALNSTFPDTNCIVSFQINPHWISNSGLWKVVLETFCEWMENWRRESCFTRTNDVVLSCWGTENSQENMEGDQPVESRSHAQQPLQPQTWGRNIVNEGFLPFKILTTEVPLHICYMYQGIIFLVSHRNIYAMHFLYDCCTKYLVCSSFLP